MVTPLRDPEDGLRALNQLLGQVARKLGVRHLGRASPPSVIADRQKLARDLRYVALNPPRARLVKDPLEWMFSTHRDVIGAVVDPWVDARRLARALGRPLDGFVAAYHRYVSGDPHVAIAGTPLPIPAIPTSIAHFPLMRIAEAGAAATRTNADAIREQTLTRDIFVHLAREQGWRSWTDLALACDCTTRTIRRIAERDVDLTAARLCLGDARLLHGVPKLR